jgi:(p)ppGpp synthase/HD superfamily hydrolase
MSNFLERAEQIAREAHMGQFYGDRDYVEAHILPVTTIIRRLGYGTKFQAAGWLHDTIEDTDITADQLINEGIPTDVVYAVELLSKKEGENHSDYLAKIITSRYATVGKFADSSANFSSTMLLSPTLEDKHVREWGLEYADNLAFLLPHLPDPSEE